MPAAMWSLMWQCRNQRPGLSHSMSPVCTLAASRFILWPGMQIVRQADNSCNQHKMSTYTML